jgi:hypothetical protein
MWMATIASWQPRPGRNPQDFGSNLASHSGSSGTFQLANGGRAFLGLIDPGSYTCTSTAPNPAPRGDAVFGFSRSPAR